MSTRRFASAQDGMNRRKRVKIDGYSFDSQAEANRYGELKLLQQAGAIERLRVHPRFNLNVKGIKVCAYVADFDYYDKERGGKYTVEDVKPKGFMTREAKLKIALFNALQSERGVTITIIER